MDYELRMRQYEKLVKFVRYWYIEEPYYWGA